MPQLGRMNRLQVVEQVSFGLYLDGDDWGDILLPKRYVPENTAINDFLDVFLYLDSEDDVIATTETPLAMVGECAFLKIVQVNKFGAFVDWGLSKDLLIPFSEQSYPLEEGRYCSVFIYIDKASERIVASTKLSFFLSEDGRDLNENMDVDLLIVGKTKLGFKAVINGEYLGLIYHSDLSVPLRFGERRKGRITRIREDGKIDLSVNLMSKDDRQTLEQRILNHLEASGGYSSLTDSASPEDINREFKVSKKNYKRALSALYKQRKIIIQKNEIRMVQ